MGLKCVPFAFKEVSRLGTNVEPDLGQTGGNSISNICSFTRMVEESSSPDTTAGRSGLFTPELESLHPMWSSLRCPICLIFPRKEETLAHAQENAECPTLCILNLIDQELVKTPSSSVSTTSTTCGGPEAGEKKLWGPTVQPGLEA